MPISPAAPSIISSASACRPMLWRKLPGARSAGRVQSVALRLICDRELEIEAFKAQEYWTIEGDFRDRSRRSLLRPPLGDRRQEARQVRHPERGLGACDRSRAGRHAFRGRAMSRASRSSVTPLPPFRTATLQQEASRKLGMSSARTMQIAQRLYEGVNIGGETVGLITYMRTDGVEIAGEAIAAARNAILKAFGEPYLPSVPRQYTTKAKNAQEAHEAIRPTDLMRFPEQVKRTLEPEQYALYELIWKRTIASQMESAEIRAHHRRSQHDRQ